jgi:hypothetical protein
MAMIPTPFRFFEMERKLMGADAPLFSQSGFGKAPEGFDAVDVALAPRKFVFMMIHSVVFEPGRKPAIPAGSGVIPSGKMNLPHEKALAEPPEI